jgi:hypothetical protein
LFTTTFLIFKGSMRYTHKPLEGKRKLTPKTILVKWAISLAIPSQIHRKLRIYGESEVSGYTARAGKDQAEPNEKLGIILLISPFLLSPCQDRTLASC